MLPEYILVYCQRHGKNIRKIFYIENSLSYAELLCNQQLPLTLGKGVLISVFVGFVRSKTALLSTLVGDEICEVESDLMLFVSLSEVNKKFKDNNQQEVISLFTYIIQYTQCCEMQFIMKFTEMRNLKWVKAMLNRYDCEFLLKTLISIH